MDKKTVLIVDDEPDILNLTSKFLNLADFDTLTSSNGKEALQLLHEKYGNIDLILLDLMMPGKNGYTVLEEIRRDPKYNKILVVLFTVKSFKEDIQKGKELGADGYITKPFSGKELVKLVREKLAA